MSRLIDFVIYLGYEDDDLVEFQRVQQIVELAVLLGLLELLRERHSESEAQEGGLTGKMC